MDLADTCERGRPVHVGMKGIGAVEDPALEREGGDVSARQQKRPVLDGGPKTPCGENHHVWRQIDGTQMPLAFEGAKCCRHRGTPTEADLEDALARAHLQ